MTKAIIEWIPLSQGGRRQPPLGIGHPAYSTVVRFLDEPWPPVDAAWSLVVEKDESLGTDLKWIARVFFLVPEAPQESLQVGRGFELYEGNKRVAIGEICSND
jgi:hypothetical protein